MFDTSETFVEKVVELKRVIKVVKGGKRLKLYACVVAGDGEGNVGVGHAKSSEVAAAIKKATVIAKKNMTKVDVTEGTILHPVKGKFSASHVILKPALTGTGIIASGPVRAVCEAAGIKNILTKSLGSNNPTNLARATVNALASVRSVAVVAEMRNKPVEYFMRKKYEKDKSDTQEESDQQDKET
ncbi:MAG: 30S ribosomal protein S5 [candidate division WOR-3 bacterium]|nr:MAG: 30S ribosomal protein S5 [candidate division WOR-3 bacterium]